MSLGRDIAEEMLFDADRSGSGGVSYDDLISCIETIDTTEVHRAMEVRDLSAECGTRLFFTPEAIFRLTLFICLYVVEQAAANASAATHGGNSSSVIARDD